MNNENNEKNTNTPAENEELDKVQEVEETQAGNVEFTGSEKKKNPNKKSFGEYIKSPRFKHGGIATAFTAGFIAIVILLNVVVSILTTRFPSLNIDMTNNGTNTLSAESVKVAQAAKYDTDLFIIGTEQVIKGDPNYSQVASLAAKFAEKNTKIKVSYVDIEKNPTFASKNSISATLAAGDVVLKTEKRNRVLTNTDLFSSQTDETGYSSETFSQVDSALASAISQVNSEKLPVAAFEKGHSNSTALDVSAFKTLLANNNFETKDFNSLTDKVPENAQLLVIPAPTTDYTDAELTKLDAFLSDTKTAGSRSLVITFDPSQKEMPKLANFLKEWGLAVKPATVIAESDATKMVSSQNPGYILAQIGTKLKLGGQSDYGYVIMPMSCPIDLLYTSQGSITTYSLATSYISSYLATESSTDKTKAAYNTAALAQKDISVGEQKYKANVIVLGSSNMISSTFLNATAFGNSKYVVDLMRYGTGVSNNDTGVAVNKVQTNVADITINSAVANILGIGLFTILIPILLLAAGIFVYLRRRHL